MNNYTDWIMDINKKMLRSQELSKPELYDKVVCKWQIDYKGSIGIETIQDHFTGDNFSDVKIGYGNVVFNGTKKQFDKLLNGLYKNNHSDYKIIGEHLVEEIDIDHDKVYQDYLNTKK